MNKKILIFGKGFIGARLHEHFKCAVSDARINTLKDAENELKKYKPDIAINCIGFIGENNTDDCDKDMDKTLFANSFVPLLLAEAAIKCKVKLIHISSGCAYNFDYTKDEPVTEDKIPDFFGLGYSRSKIYSELALKNLSSQYDILIAKIRIPLDVNPHPKNILTKLLKYQKVIDIPNSITYIPDFIQMLEHLIKIDAKGVYNLVNKNGLRYPALLNIYKKHVPEFNFTKTTLKDLNLVRTNLVLSTDKLEKTGFNVRDIHDVLEECVKGYLDKK